VDAGTVQKSSCPDNKAHVPAGGDPGPRQLETALYRIEPIMSFDDLLYEKNGAVATITLNRPDRLNALGKTTTRQLCRASADAVDDPEVRVLVITGAGDAFCAGGDYKDTFEPGFEKTEQQWRQRIRTGPNQLVRILEEAEKPVIACVNGLAVGGGATIALACDFRIASERARFSFPFSRIGVTPEFGCTYLLPRVVGFAKAMELLFLADMTDAREAERIGLVNQVVPHEHLADATGKLVARLLERPPAALGTMKSMLYRSLSMDLQAVLEMEAFAISAAFKTAEHQAAVKAFLQRKKSEPTSG
jgi:2-(1,2-epoxy-1,2-dihydrophenyl)acetyl-CoA isomerase